MAGTTAMMTKVSFSGIKNGRLHKQPPVFLLPDGSRMTEIDRLGPFSFNRMLPA